MVDFVHSAISQEINSKEDEKEPATVQLNFSELESITTTKKDLKNFLEKHQL